MKEVRVRFAPSPTGSLHVGGARTAIFNWLFARNQGGKFLVRIEDTDLERSKSELTEQIIRSMKWLKIESDEQIVYQAANVKRHKEIVNELIKKKKAYYCFESPEELEIKRNEAHQKKEYYKYDRAALKLSEDKIKEYLNKNKPYTVRFFVPDGFTKFDDIVHGGTVFNNSEIDDFIIQRSDGTPVYQVAVVVDDHDMEITHIIRGDDHLSNTPKQIMIYNAMNWDMPQFGHLPLILDADKKKLSKRRNTVSCVEYKDKGYLPEAMFNFLTLLGYAPKNQKEIISRDDLVKEFSFDRVNKKSAVFDMKKLDWINFEYLKLLNRSELIKLIRERLKDNSFSNEYINSVIDLMLVRAVTLNDFTEKGKYFFQEPEVYDEVSVKKYLNDETKDSLKIYFERIQFLNDFSKEILEDSLRQIAEEKKIKAGNIIHPLRIALTGGTASPGIFEVMEVLGKEKVVERMNRFLDRYVS